MISESGADAIRQWISGARAYGADTIPFLKKRVNGVTVGSRRMVTPGLYGEVIGDSVKEPGSVVVAVTLQDVERWLGEVEIVPDSEMPGAATEKSEE